MKFVNVNDCGRGCPKVPNLNEGRVNETGVRTDVRTDVSLTARLAIFIVPVIRGRLAFPQRGRRGLVLVIWAPTPFSC